MGPIRYNKSGNFRDVQGKINIGIFEKSHMEKIMYMSQVPRIRECANHGLTNI